jgi:hypothetical protein
MIIEWVICLVMFLDAMMASGSLTGIVFPLLPPLPDSREFLVHLLALFSSGIVILDIYVVLISI